MTLACLPDDVVVLILNALDNLDKLGVSSTSLRYMQLLRNLQFYPTPDPKMFLNIPIIDYPLLSRVIKTKSRESLGEITSSPYARFGVVVSFFRRSKVGWERLLKHECQHFRYYYDRLWSHGYILDVVIFNNEVEHIYSHIVSCLMFRHGEIGRKHSMAAVFAAAESGDEKVIRTAIILSPGDLFVPAIKEENYNLLGVLCKITSPGPYAMSFASPKIREFIDQAKHENIKCHSDPRDHRESKALQELGGRAACQALQSKDSSASTPLLH